MKNEKSRDGFTLVELIVILAMTALLSTAGFLNLVSFKHNKTLILNKDKMVGYLQTAREKAINQEGGYKWGVRFDNTNSDNGSFTIFFGDTYSLSGKREMHYLNSGVKFVNPPSGQVLDVIFEKRTGSISLEQRITIENMSLPGNFGEASVSLMGLIDSRLY